MLLLHLRICSLSTFSAWFRNGLFVHCNHLERYIHFINLNWFQSVTVGVKGLFLSLSLSPCFHSHLAHSIRMTGNIRRTHIHIQSQISVKSHKYTLNKFAHCSLSIRSDITICTAGHVNNTQFRLALYRPHVLNTQWAFEKGSTVFFPPLMPSIQCVHNTWIDGADCET